MPNAVTQLSPCAYPFDVEDAMESSHPEVTQDSSIRQELGTRTRLPRVAIVGTGFVGSTSYSGADQQFDTGSGLGSPSPQRRLERIEPAGAAGLRLTAPIRRGGAVSLRAPAGNALQYWTAGNGPGGSQTTLVNARTGLCLDVSGGSLKTGPAVVTNGCRAGARSQLWRLVRSGPGRWRFVNRRSGKALSALVRTHRVVQSNNSAGAQVPWTTRSVRGQ